MPLPHGSHLQQELTMTEQQPNANSAASSDTPTVSAVEQTNASRRKFITRAGVVSIPTIMAINSGSAFGCINLGCTPGQTNLSGTTSAVASAVANPQNTPNKAYKIPLWPKVDLIQRIVAVDFDKYLIDIGQPAKFNGKTIKGSSTLKQIFGSSLTLTSSQSNAKVFTYTVASDNSIRATGGLLTHTTLCGLFLSAFLGAVWERHPRYRQEFNQNNGPYCYPEPSALISAYNKAMLTSAGQNEFKELMEIYMRYRKLA